MTALGRPGTLTLRTNNADQYQNKFNSTMHPASKTLRGGPVHNLSDQIMNWASSKCKFSHRLRIKLRINFALPIHKVGSWSSLILGILALATLNTTAAEVTSRNSNAVNAVWKTKDKHHPEQCVSYPDALASLLHIFSIPRSQSLWISNFADLQPNAFAKKNNKHWSN